jgi:hypothetical protein
MSVPPEQEKPLVNMPDLQKLTETATDAKKTLSESVGNIGSQVSNIGNTIGKSLDDFSSTSAADAGKEFLEANTIVAKFSFIIIVLIGFLFLFRLGMIIMSYIFSPSRSPYLVKGMLEGNSAKQIKQDPRTDNTTIFLSENERTGLEFTYSIWLYLDGIDTNAQLKHIFNKGIIDTTTNFAAIDPTSKALTSSSTLNKTYNAPGLYTYKNNDGSISLRVFMDSYIQTGNMDNLSGQVQTIDITDVPIKKWFNTTIRVENRVMDVYINGTLTKRKDIESIPRQNFSDVYVCQAGGFSGKLSNLRYFNKSLNVFEINAIVNSGPTLTPAESDDASEKGLSNYNYLSSNWYSSKI